MSDTTTRGDMKISGAGTISTGSFRNVGVDGSATLMGDIDCLKFKINGAADGSGTLKAESIVVNGSFGYQGSAKADDVRIAGTARFGALDAGTLSVAGTLAAEQLTAGELKVSGYLSLDGDCEAEHFKTIGGFQVGGLLNAGVVDVELSGPCSAREIGGETIVVRPGKGAVRRLVAKLVPSTADRLTAEAIEGDDVRLESTTAGAVRGRTVVIGPGCVVDLVEYADEYSAAPDAKVKKVVKVGDAGQAAV